MEPMLVKILLEFSKAEAEVRENVEKERKKTWESSAHKLLCAKMGEYQLDAIGRCRDVVLAAYSELEKK
jgi:hypothetical protein